MKSKFTNILRRKGSGLWGTNVSNRVLKDIIHVDSLTNWEFTRVNTSKAIGPERELVMAVLEDAVHHALNPRKSLNRDAAREWFAETEESDWIFTFVNVCETLGFNSDSIRHKVQSQYKVHKKLAA